jgi:hypothetical protein
MRPRIPEGVDWEILCEVARRSSGRRRKNDG